MMRHGRVAIALWLVYVAICVGLISRAQFTADLSAFLPRAPTAEQQLLVDQLKSGVASRLVLVGIEGGTPAQRAQASQAVASRLRADSQFLHVANGESVGLERDRQLLFDNRYLLSPAVDTERFSVEGLHAAHRGPAGGRPQKSAPVFPHRAGRDLGRGDRGDPDSPHELPLQ